MEERFMIYAVLIACSNLPKYDSIIFGSLRKKARRTFQHKKSKKLNCSEEKKKWAFSERIIAIYYFIVPVPPPNLWLAKRTLQGLLEKKLVIYSGEARKYKNNLGDAIIYSTAKLRDNFEIEKYLYRV
jgi:hypothetical protein